MRVRSIHRRNVLTVAAETIAVPLFRRVELDSWIEQRWKPGGGFKLVGMGRRVEFDENGQIVSDVIEPTGLSFIFT